MFCEQKNVFLKNVKIYDKLKTPLYIIYIYIVYHTTLYIVKTPYKNYDILPLNAIYMLFLVVNKIIYG